MDEVTGVVVGAGVVGLAVARALALERPGEWLVLEQADAIGTQTSARNSEVIHAGIYYPQDSLKARLCVRGKALLYDYLNARGLPHRRCGKLIVATHPDQLQTLAAIEAKAHANGVSDVHWLSALQAQQMEPALACHAALHSPSTGIVDSHALMLSLQGDLEHAGGWVALRAQLEQVRCLSPGFELQLHDGTCLRSQYLVNAAGLSAPSLARQMLGYNSGLAPTAYFAKGNYFVLSGRSPFQHLIYPVPEAAGLGVHLTLDLGHQAKFGPDVQWVTDAQDLQVDPRRGEGFYEQVRKYWPGLPDGSLQPGYAGIRPKISGPDEPAADFVVQGPAVHGVPGLVQLFGIESPGLTSCLALAETVVQSL